jgi:hypothetical protein
MLRFTESHGGAHWRSISLSLPSKSKRSIVNTKFLCSLAVAGAFAFGGTGSALAAPAGSEGPENCTFSKGTTTCAHVGDPVVTTSTSTDGAGCTLTHKTTTITTTYSAHRGTYNSNGKAVPAPASTSTESTVLDSKVCPPADGPGQAECEALGYNYEGSRPGSVYGYAATIQFSCGEGNGLTYEQAWAISWTGVHSSGCATRNASDNWWGTVTGTQGSAYYICYTHEQPLRPV